MSDRNLVLPDRALHDLLQDMERRIAVVQRRIRWPGATQFDEDVGPTALTATASGPLVFDELCTVTLVPGRWFFVAGTSVDHTEPDAYSILGYLTDDAAVTFFAATERQGDSSAASGATIDPLSVAGTLVLTEDTTITWEVAFGYDNSGGAGSADATYSYLIAVPA